MGIEKGEVLPGATFLRVGDNGPETVSLGERMKGRKIVIFAVPGAYTGVCTTAHVPSFIRVMDGLKAKGIAEVICIAVNDPFVMKAWGEATGATAAGITLLADAESAFTSAIGMEFSAPPAGLINRSLRYAMVVDDGVVTVLNKEETPGVCDISGGEAILDAV